MIFVRLIKKVDIKIVFIFYSPYEKADERYQRGLFGEL